MTNSESSNRAQVTISTAAWLAIAALGIGLLVAPKADARRLSEKTRAARTSSTKQRVAQRRQEQKKTQKRHGAPTPPAPVTTISPSTSSGSPAPSASEAPALTTTPNPPAAEEAPAVGPEAPSTPPSTPEPAPEPETTHASEAPATQPAPSPIFFGAKISDFWINHSAPGAITEVPDPAGSGEKVIKMTVSDKDVYPITPTENPRAELLSPALITAGKEVWLKTKFFIPTDYPATPDGGWVSLVSFYGAPFEGASPWRIELSGDTIQWERNGTYGYDVPWQTPLEKGRWYTVLTHERFAKEGFVEMWINGQKISFFSSGGYNPHRIAPTEKLEMATMDASNDEGANSAKIMQYRKLGMFESGTIYFGPLVLGESRESVEG